MTNISNKKLPHIKQEKLFDEFSHVLSELKVVETKLFLSELLGPEEQIMLTKRFAAIILLEKGCSIYKTANILHLSTATVSKLNRQRILGSYINITRWLVQKPRNVIRFLELIDSVLTLGGTLPQYGKQAEALKKIK